MFWAVAVDTLVVSPAALRTAEAASVRFLNAVDYITAVIVMLAEIHVHVGNDLTQ